MVFYGRVLVIRKIIIWGPATKIVAIRNSISFFCHSNSWEILRLNARYSGSEIVECNVIALFAFVNCPTKTIIIIFTAPQFLSIEQIRYFHCAIISGTWLPTQFLIRT